MSEKRQIQPKTWYLGIVLKRTYSKHQVLLLYRREFNNHSDVLHFMKINNKTGDLAYLPIKGSDAIQYGFKFIKSRSLYARITRLFSYDYPVERLSEQDRKSFRTKARRWMRNYKVRLNTFNDINFSIRTK